jgi:hypothetical protein
MPNIEDFMDGVVAEFRGRLALLGDSGDRRAIEDGIALLAAYRRSDMDVARFEMLLSTLRSGRCPDGLSVLRPERLAAELDRLLAAYRAERGAIEDEIALAHAGASAVAALSGAEAPPLLSAVN